MPAWMTPMPCGGAGSAFGCLATMPELRSGLDVSGVSPRLFEPAGAGNSGGPTRDALEPARSIALAVQHIPGVGASGGPPAEQALNFAHRALHEQPRSGTSMDIAAAACSHLGRIGEGREWSHACAKCVRAGTLPPSSDSAAGSLRPRSVLCLSKAFARPACPRREGLPITSGRYCARNSNAGRLAKSVMRFIRERGLMHIPPIGSAR